MTPTNIYIYIYRHEFTLRPVPLRTTLPRVLVRITTAPAEGSFHGRPFSFSFTWQNSKKAPIRARSPSLQPVPITLAIPSWFHALSIYKNISQDHPKVFIECSKIGIHSKRKLYARLSKVEENIVLFISSGYFCSCYHECRRKLTISIEKWVRDLDLEWKYPFCAGPCSSQTFDFEAYQNMRDHLRVFPH